MRRVATRTSSDSGPGMASRHSATSTLPAARSAARAGRSSGRTSFRRASVAALVTIECPVRRGLLERLQQCGHRAPSHRDDLRDVDITRSIGSRSPELVEELAHALVRHRITRRPRGPKLVEETLQPISRARRPGVAEAAPACLPIRMLPCPPERARVRSTTTRWSSAAFAG